MSLINERVNDFKVSGFQNGENIQVTLQDILGHWSIFVFYPTAIASAEELQNLQANYAKIKKSGTELYVVLEDYSKKQYEAFKKVQYPLLNDSERSLARIFDVVDVESDEVCYSTFVVCPGAKIKAYNVSVEKIGPSIDQTIAIMNKAQLIKRQPKSCSLK